MELIEIEAFITIVQTGSFTSAAAALSISQPAVSRRIDLLETELGMPLFERVHSGARLTPAGDAFLPHARQVLAAVRDGTAAIHALQSGKHGSVRLALVGTLASTSMTDRLRSFRKTFPDIRLAVQTARSAEVSTMVQQGEAQIGLRYFDDPAPTIASINVADESLVVVCATDCHVASQDRISPEALRGIPWVAFPVNAGSSGEPFSRVLQHVLARNALEDADIIPIDSLTAQKRLVEAGFGIGLLPVSSVVEERRLGTLTVLDVKQLRASVPVTAIYRRDGYLSPAALNLLESLQEGKRDQHDHD